jgi:hypothetical protein
VAFAEFRFRSPRLSLLTPVSSHYHLFELVCVYHLHIHLHHLSVLMLYYHIGLAPTPLVPPSSTLAHALSPVHLSIHLLTDAPPPLATSLIILSRQLAISTRPRSQWLTFFTRRQQLRMWRILELQKLMLSTHLLMMNRHDHRQSGLLVKLKS